MLKRNEDVDIQVGPYDLSEDCLPDRPSALIRVALADLERTLLNPAYRFIFSNWHWPLPNGRCNICLAGGVIAQSAGMGPDLQANWSGCSINTHGKLLALSSFAAGDIAAGLYMTIGKLRYLTFGSWPKRGHHINDLNVLKDELDTLAADLEAAGL